MGECADYLIDSQINYDGIGGRKPIGWKKKRKSNTSWSTDYLKKNGIEFESKNGGAHLIIGDYDFWPSTGLFINRITKKKLRGVRVLVKLLRQEDE